MDSVVSWLIAVIILGAIAIWRGRARLAALLREPTPGFLRVCRITGHLACSLCGIACVLLIWAGTTQPQISWLYALLGVVVFILNLLLFVHPQRR